MESVKSRENIISVLRSGFSAFYDSSLTLVYPQACRICEKSVESRADGIVCADCWEKTRVFAGQEIICQKCGAFLKEKGFQAETFCRNCQGADYDSARAVGLYENALAVSVVNLKTEPFISGRLKKLFFQAFLNSPFQDASRIIPVPLSRERFTERGFNQASILARVLAEQTCLTMDEQSLARATHAAKHRAGMDRRARSESVKNAFKVIRPRLVAGETILLVDDVFTTGATVSNCAKALKKEGARNVYVLTIARAV